MAIFRILNFFKDHQNKIDYSSLWTKILDSNKNLWSECQNEQNNQNKVLVATSLGGYNNGTILESLLSVALTLRKVRVDILLCDQSLPVCQLTKINKILPEELIEKGQEKICRVCFKQGKEIFLPLGLKLHFFSNFISQEDIGIVNTISSSIPKNKISEYSFNGLAVGEHAIAGALRYFAKGDLLNERFGESILRKYLNAALLTCLAVTKLLNRNNYKVACFHHGIYVPQGLIGEVCRKNGIRVVNSNPTYRKHTFIFSHQDTYHHTMISEPTKVWENITWNKKLETKTINYLNSRWNGSQDWIWFHEKPHENLKKAALEFDIDFSKPCIGMLTSVAWDAQLHYRSNAFPNMKEWVNFTIRYFASRPDLQLIIRIHPAEIRGLVPSRQPLFLEINENFPVLPSNISIIPPESGISTYALMKKCSSVIIYNTKMGIEISSMGIPVIVAGEAWIRNKGFSLDAKTPEEYSSILDRLPLSSKLTENEINRAYKYAFHFFFRRMIGLEFIVSPEKFTFDIKIKNLKELAPGHHKGLDIICNGILNGTPFIYPAEKL